LIWPSPSDSSFMSILLELLRSILLVLFIRLITLSMMTKSKNTLNVIFGRSNNYQK
jgi:hypothetical protein